MNPRSFPSHPSLVLTLVIQMTDSTGKRNLTKPILEDTTTQHHVTRTKDLNSNRAKEVEIEPSTTTTIFLTKARTVIFNHTTIMLRSVDPCRTCLKMWQTLCTSKGR